MSRNTTVSDHSHTCRGILSFLLYLKIRTLSGTRFFLAVSSEDTHTRRDILSFLPYLKTLVGTSCLWNCISSLRHTDLLRYFVFDTVSSQDTQDFDRKNPPPMGVSYLLFSMIKNLLSVNLLRHFVFDTVSQDTRTCCYIWSILLYLKTHTLVGIFCLSHRLWTRHTCLFDCLRMHWRTSATWFLHNFVTIGWLRLVGCLEL